MFDDFRAMIGPVTVDGAALTGPNLVGEAGDRDLFRHLYAAFSDYTDTALNTKSELVASVGMFFNTFADRFLSREEREQLLRKLLDKSGAADLSTRQAQ